MRNALHIIVNLILVILVTLGVYFGLTNLGLMPVEASVQAKPIDWLFDIEVWLTAFFFAVIMVPMLYSLFVFRQKKGETAEGSHIEGNTTLELTWLIIPFIIVVWLGIVGADNLRQVRAVDPQAIEIRVIASQWNWQFEYPHGVQSPILRLPVNKQVVLKMESIDVIHSFWVPEFRIKQDIVPGMITDYRVTPSLIGNYKVRCAELCGTKHEEMERDVIVLSEEDYQAWLDGETAAAISAQATADADPNPSPSRGEKLYTQIGCSGCHSLTGAEGLGPTWKHLFGEEVRLTDGSVVIADDAYLTESIKFPQNKIVANFKPGMPDFKLTDKQIADLVAFIKTIK
jgi:cytochrome c oxidase subunit 2